MAFDKKSLDDYVEVHVRVAAFKKQFPQGSLQSEIAEHIPGTWVESVRYNQQNQPYKVMERSQGLIIMKGLAYRTPDDPRPGIGFSSMEIPGTTPYTKGSEVENAETSAWGRALAALGYEIKKSIASANEIANKRTEPPHVAPQQPGTPVTTPPRTSTGGRPDYVSELQFKNLMDTAERTMGKGNGTMKVAMWCLELKCTEKTTTREQWKTMMEWIVNGEPEIREPGDESQEDLEAGFRASIDGDESWKNQHPKGDNMDLTGEQLSQDLDAALGTVNQAMDRVGQQSNDGTKISVAQGRRLFAIAKGNKQLLKTTLADFGFASDRDIPWKRYEEVCKAVEDAVREAGATA